jgi:hypothetical protein
LEQGPVLVQEQSQQMQPQAQTASAQGQPVQQELMWERSPLVPAQREQAQGPVRWRLTVEQGLEPAPERPVSRPLAPVGEGALRWSIRP